MWEITNHTFSDFNGVLFIGIFLAIFFGIFLESLKSFIEDLF